MSLERLTLRLDRALVESLQKIAAEQERSLNSLMSLIIKGFVVAHEGEGQKLGFPQSGVKVTSKWRQSDVKVPLIESNNFRHLATYPQAECKNTPYSTSTKDNSTVLSTTNISTVPSTSTVQLGFCTTPEDPSTVQENSPAPIPSVKSKRASKKEKSTEAYKLPDRSGNERKPHAQCPMLWLSENEITRLEKKFQTRGLRKEFYFEAYNKVQTWFRESAKGRKEYPMSVEHASRIGDFGLDAALSKQAAQDKALRATSYGGQNSSFNKASNNYGLTIPVGIGGFRDDKK